MGMKRKIDCTELSSSRTTFGRESAAQPVPTGASECRSRASGHEFVCAGEGERERKREGGREREEDLKT